MANKLFFESFDHPYWSYDKLWTSKNSTGDVADATAGRNGNGFRFASASSSKWLGKNLGEYVPQMVLGFAFKLPASASTGFWTRRWETLCQFQSQDFAGKVNLWLLALPDSSAGTSFRLAGRMFHSTLGLDWIYDSADVIEQATSSISLSVDTWYYIEVDVLFGVSGGGHMKTYVDGELAFEATDIKTVNSTVSGTAWGSFLLGGYGVGDGVTIPTAYAYGYFDDVYCHYGDSPTRLGDLTVGHKDLTGAGLSSAWAAYPSGTALANLTDNSAATGISSSVLNDQHNFTIEALGVTPETIHGVQVCAVGQKTDSGARSLALTALSRSYTGVLTGTPANTNAVTIGTAGAEKIYTFKTALTSSTAANEVLVGGDAEESMNNLAAAILGGSGAGTLYGSDTVAHTKISAAVVTTGPLALTVTGNAGEDLSTQATTATGGVSWAAATLAANLDEDVSGDLPMSASAKNFIHTFTVDPRTNLAWTEDWVDAAYIGVKCR